MYYISMFKMKNSSILKILCMLSAAVIGWTYTSSTIAKPEDKSVDTADSYFAAPNDAGGHIVLTFNQNYCLPYLDYAPGKRLYDGYITAPNLPKRYFCWSNQITEGYVDVVFLDAGKGGLSSRARYDEGYFKRYNPDKAERITPSKDTPKPAPVPDFNTKSTFRMFDHTTGGYLH